MTNLLATGGVNVFQQDEQLIETERIRSVFGQIPLTLLVTIGNALLTAIVLAPVVRSSLLMIWVAAIVAVSGVRWAAREVFLARSASATAGRLWASVSVLGSLTTGTLWGAVATVLTTAGETYQLFFSFVVGGMCAGTTAVNSANMPTVVAFILPASLPLAVMLLFEGSTPQLVSGLMVIVFALALSCASARAHRAFGNRIRLQIALAQQGHALTEANERLRSEITERQKAEATLHQAQKMDAIGHLTGGIAHDFNNLLHVVTGNLSMIGRLADGHPQILNYVEAAEQAAYRGAQLTSSLLAFGRRQTLQVKPVNLNELVQEFLPILLRAAGEAIQVRTSLAPDLPRCNADPAHFQSAILNLVINARDAMPDGGQLSITTNVTILKTDDLLSNENAVAGRFVSILVQDNGSGMTPDVLAQAFEPFFTTKEIGKGSGLGLSQVYGFARQLGGHVELRSEPRTGTGVTLHLPAISEA